MVTHSSTDIVRRLENRAETLAQTALNSRDTRLIKLLETAAKEITSLRASLATASGEAASPSAPVDLLTDALNELRTCPETNAKAIASVEAARTAIYMRGGAQAGRDPYTDDLKFANEQNIKAARKYKASLAECDGQMQLAMAEIDRIRAAIFEIQKATLEGRVCADVAWFDGTTTLHDFCDFILNEPDDGSPLPSTNREDYDPCGYKLPSPPR